MSVRYHSGSARTYAKETLDELPARRRHRTTVDLGISRKGDSAREPRLGRMVRCSSRTPTPPALLDTPRIIEPYHLAQVLAVRSQARCHRLQATLFAPTTKAA